MKTTNPRTPTLSYSRGRRAWAELLGKDRSIQILPGRLLSVFSFVIYSISIAHAQNVPLSKIIYSNDRPIAPAIQFDSFAFGRPSIDSSGNVGFSARLLIGSGGVASNNRETVFVGSSSGVTLVCRTGTAEGAGTPWSIDANRPLLANNGAIAIGGSTITSDVKNAVWYRPNAGSSSSLLARVGSDAGIAASPGATWSSVNLIGHSAVVENRVLMRGGLSSSPSGIFSWTPSEGVKSIQKWGDIAPGTSNLFGKLDASSTNFQGEPKVNGVGRVAFSAFLQGAGVNGTNETGIWRENNVGNLQLVARSGMAAPGSGGTFVGLGENGVGGLNDSGLVAFQSRLIGATGSSSGIWTGSYTGDLSLVVKAGDLATGTSNSFLGFTGKSVKIASDGSIGFLGFVTGAGVSSVNDSGFWYGKAGDIRLLAREDSLAAGFSATENIRYGTLPFESVTNGNGQTAFQTTLRGTSITTANDNAIFALDPLGQSVRVIRESDQIDRGDGVLRTVASVDFPTDTNTDLTSWSKSFSDRGQLALSVRFTGGDSGIYVADVGKSSVEGNFLVGSAQSRTVYGGVSVEPTGALVNNGIITGDVQVAGTLAGSGLIVGQVDLQSGAILSPGNSPGTLTTGSQIWNGGSNVKFEINNALGINGTNWDFVDINGNLTIAATPSTPVKIDVISLDTMNNTGLTSNFNSSLSNSWELLRADSGINGFLASLFEVNTSGFQNSLDGGSFSVSHSGNSLYLNFSNLSAVPEPATFLPAILLGLVANISYRKRRTRQID